MHGTYGTRWVDYKSPSRYSLTAAQRLKWPIWDAYGVGIWIMTAATDDEYRKLFEEANWRQYWKPSYGPTVDALLDEVR